VPEADIVDTRSGLGAPHKQVPPGGSLTVQVTGAGGVPSGAPGAALFIGAANATEAGYVSAYPAGGPPSSLSMLSYSPNRTTHDLYFGALSSGGQLTLVNQGAVPVDLLVSVQGYLVSPSTIEAGSAYQDVPEDRIADTRFGTGGVPATPVPAGGSITFAATGIDDVPATGVPSVAESVAAVSPTGNGYLSVYPAGTADPKQPGVNFNTGDDGDNDMSAPLLSQVSPTGQETITNHSSGTVDIIVSVRGYYQAPTQPSEPKSVAASISGTSATVVWVAPATDGGAAITSYTVTAAPDNATVTVGPGTYQTTLTGLTSASADTYTVTAVNAVGTSEGGSFGPMTQVLSGTLLYPAAPSNLPVQNDQVLIYDVPLGTSPPTQTLIGTTTTDQAGDWSFALPAFASLPATVQADALANNGILNVEADAYATATTASGTSYMESAETYESAWVGTGTQSPPPGLGPPLAQTMILTPAGPDNSGQNTPANQAATWASQNDPAITDGPVDPNAGPPLNAYGYQTIGTNNNYDPYIAYDGTDLTGVTPLPFILSQHPPCSNWYTVPFAGPKWSIIGEVHTSNDSSGSFAYTKGSQTTFGIEFSADSGQDWSADGSITISNNSSSLTSTWPTIGPNDSRRTKLLEMYEELQHNYATCEGYKAFHTDKIWAEGTYVNHNVFPLGYGKAGYLNGTDTFTGYCLEKINHLYWTQRIARGFTETWNWGSGYGFKLGATVEGAGLGTETDYTTITSVIYTAGKRSYDHWTWGVNGNPIYGGQGYGAKYGGDPKIIHAYDIPSGTPPCA